MVDAGAVTRSVRNELDARLAPFREALARHRLFAAAGWAAVAAGTTLLAIRLAAALVPVPPLAPSGVVLALVATAITAALITSTRLPGPARASSILDRRLGTRELVTTAVEWLRERPGDAFSPVLARRAGDALGGRSPDEVVPFEGRALRRAAVVVVAAVLLAELLPRAVPVMNPASAGDEPVEASALAHVEQQLAALERAAGAARTPRAREAARSVSAMLDEFRKRPPSRRQALEKLSRTLDKVTSERRTVRASRLPARLTRTFGASRLTEPVARSLRQNDPKEALRALDDLARKLAKTPPTPEEERELERLVKQMAKAVSEEILASDEEEAQDSTPGDGLTKPLDSPALKERKGRDQALLKLAELMSKMDPKKLDEALKALKDTVEKVETVGTETLDRQAIEEMIRALQEGKTCVGQGCKGECKRVVRLAVAGAKTGRQNSPAGKGQGSPGSGQAAGNGEGQDRDEEKGTKNRQWGEEIHPWDPGDLKGSARPRRPPRETSTSGPTMGVKGRTAGPGGTDVATVRAAPRRPQGTASEAPPASAPVAPGEVEAIERSNVPAEYRRLVRDYFDRTKR